MRGTEGESQRQYACLLLSSSKGRPFNTMVGSVPVPRHGPSSRFLPPSLPFPSSGSSVVVAFDINTTHPDSLRFSAIAPNPSFRTETNDVDEECKTSLAKISHREIHHRDFHTGGDHKCRLDLVQFAAVGILHVIHPLYNHSFPLRFFSAFFLSFTWRQSTTVHISAFFLLASSRLAARVEGSKKWLKIRTSRS